MNIERLFIDYGIPIAPSGQKHTRKGWVNVACPFCTGNPGYHLGYNIRQDRFVCWRCGGHGKLQTLVALLRVDYKVAASIVLKYNLVPREEKEIESKHHLTQLQYPTNLTTLKTNHKQYLIERKFDPNEIEYVWGVKGSGVYSKLGNANYRHRIIIPYKYEGTEVSFNSRDITKKAEAKYMACPEEFEVMSHKEILYGDATTYGDVGICVEGPTDVWRFKRSTVATSGIKYRMKQVRLLSKLFKRTFVVYDDDPQAVIMQKKLVDELKFRGVDAYGISIKGDPGSMTQADANYFVKQLLKK